MDVYRKNSMWHCVSIENYQMLSQSYMYYTKEEAISKFKEYLKEMGEN